MVRMARQRQKISTMRTAMVQTEPIVMYVIRFSPTDGSGDDGVGRVVVTGPVDGDVKQ